MRVIREKLVRGKRQITVEVEAGEVLQGIDPDKVYRLGNPMDMNVSGHYLTDLPEAVWCSASQQWVW